MQIMQIAIPDHNDSVIECEMDGQTYFLHLGWNSEMQSWELGVEDAQSERIIEGIPVNPMTDLLGSFRHLPLPQGMLCAVPIDDQDLDRLSFVDGRAELVYCYPDAAPKTAVSYAIGGL